MPLMLGPFLGCSKYAGELLAPSPKVCPACSAPGLAGEKSNTQLSTRFCLLNVLPRCISVCLLPKQPPSAACRNPAWVQRRGSGACLALNAF